MTKKAPLWVFSTLVLVMVAACWKNNDSHDERQDAPPDSGTLTPEAPAPTPPPAPAPAAKGDRTLRTGSQYVAAVAKSLNLAPAQLAEAYTKVQPNLPSSPEVNSKNVHDAFWTSVSFIAATGCMLHIETYPKDAPIPYEALIKELADKVFMNEAAAQNAAQQALTHAASLGEKDTRVMGHTGCTMLISTLAFF